MRVLLLLVIIPLLVAYGAELGLGAHPCKLCYYERYIYMACVGVIAFCIIFKLENSAAAYILLLAIVLLGLGITGYHVAIEQGWLHETGSCGTGNLAADFEEFKRSLEGKNLVACDQSYKLFDLISMAQLNFFYLIGVITFVANRQLSLLKKLKTSK